jgi:hypothetical protein
MTVRDIFNHMDEVAMIYTVEIHPPTRMSSVVVINLEQEDNGKIATVNEVK